MQRRPVDPVLGGDGASTCSRSSRVPVRAGDREHGAGLPGAGVRAEQRDQLGERRVLRQPVPALAAASSREAVASARSTEDLPTVTCGPEPAAFGRSGDVVGGEQRERVAGGGEEPQVGGRRRAGHGPGDVAGCGQFHGRRSASLGGSVAVGEGVGVGLAVGLVVGPGVAVGVGR